MPFPAPPPAVPPTPLTEVDAAIERLHAKKDTWLSVDLPGRIALLDRCVASIAAVAGRWADIGARIKGLSPDENLAGEEWIAGIMPTVRNARLLAEALRAGGQRTPTAVRAAPNGQLVARVHPANVMERLMFSGMTVDVWIAKGKSATQGAIYRDRAARLAAGSGGRVCLVLGGGNVSSIPPMDVLYKLFVEDEVVLLKLNPVNEALAPILTEALAPLVSEGVLAIVTGGAEVGSHAAQHAKIGSLHVTGSDRTYDAIVWGSDPEEQARRKKSGEKLNDRSFTRRARLRHAGDRGARPLVGGRHQVPGAARRGDGHAERELQLQRREGDRHPRAAGCSARRSSMRSTRSSARRARARPTTRARRAAIARSSSSTPMR